LDELKGGVVMSMSKRYAAALAKARKASSDFRQAQADYRSRKIGDAEFLKARAAYKRSDEALDQAVSLENAREAKENRITSSRVFPLKR
jgi:hypothetical protein